MRLAWLIGVLGAACAADLGATADGGGATGGDGPAVVAACPRVRADVPGEVLNVRSSANTTSDVVGSLPDRALATVLAQVDGEVVDGVTTWYEIESGVMRGFVSGAFASCTTDEPPMLTVGAYHLPLVCGQAARISQGNGGTTSHQGRSLYAFDFAVGLETPIVAMADGVVTYTFAETGPGDACYGGGGPSCGPAANYVVLGHGDGTGSIYKHLNRVDVAVGEVVTSGAQLGLSGTTGYSTGPHAHVMRTEDCGVALCNSIPMTFADRRRVLGLVEAAAARQSQGA